jgi:hypothetical protein
MSSRLFARLHHTKPSVPARVNNAEVVTPQSLGLPATQPPPALPRTIQATARLVLAIDATASRAPAWNASQRVMGGLFTALPGELEVALAVHGGSRVHTFTGFTSKVETLRKQSARVQCQAGMTAMLNILAAVLKLDVRVIVYVGDVFEESHRGARRLANALAAKGTRVIILHDGGSPEDADGRIFQEIASITGGAVLPFDASALDELGELLRAIAVLAVGGTQMVAVQQANLPAAPLLLRRLAASRQLLLGHSK